MLVQYALNYLQTKIQKIDPQWSLEQSSPRSTGSEDHDLGSFIFLNDESTGKPLFQSVSGSHEQNHLGLLKDTVKRLQTLPGDAKLSEILSILHGYKKTGEELDSSPYYNEVINPLEIELVREQEALAKMKQDLLEHLEPEDLAQLEQGENFAESEEERLAKIERERLQLIAQESHVRTEQERSSQESKQNHEASMDYYSELTKLRPTLEPAISSRLETLLANVAKLNEDESKEKNRIFETTYELLTKKMPVEEYRTFAKTVQGKPSPLLTLIGSIMLSIAAVLITLALITTGGLSLPFVAPAVTIAAPGIYSLFAGRQKGISKDMEDLSNTFSPQL